MYNILSVVLLSRFSPFVDEILGGRQRGFNLNIKFETFLEKKLEHSEAVQQLFIDCKKTYDLVRKAVLYIIFIESGVPMKRVRLFEMCLN
jgi:hypothetical protein